MVLKANHQEQPAPLARHEDLLVRVGAMRDKPAFIELFHYFAPRIKSYLLKHGADESTAEEIAQNTMITVWEKAHSYSPAKAAASTWIFTIARNKRIDALRKQKFVEVNSDSPALAQAAAAEPQESYADAQTIEKLSSALKGLPEEQSRLIRMAFFEDHSHREISEKTKLPLGTVKSRLRLALEKLRRALGMVQK
jgi:RNA polymerase sigma-70 factor (ECF subfamily)